MLLVLFSGGPPAGAEVAPELAHPAAPGERQGGIDPRKGDLVQRRQDPAPGPSWHHQGPSVGGAARQGVGNLEFETWEFRSLEVERQAGMWPSQTGRRPRREAGSQAGRQAAEQTGRQPSGRAFGHPDCSAARQAGRQLATRNQGAAAGKGRGRQALALH